MAGGGNLLTVKALAVRMGPALVAGTWLASSAGTEGGPMVFAISAILIGVVGMVYVRKRSGRKRDQTA